MAGDPRRPIGLEPREPEGRNPVVGHGWVGSGEPCPQWVPLWKLFPEPRPGWWLDGRWENPDGTTKGRYSPGL